MAFLSMSNLIHRAGLAVLTAVLCSAPALAQALNEYHVKAAFLYNFAKFVEWPAQSFKSSSDPIAICVLGENPFGDSLNDTVGAKAVGGRSFAIRHVTQASHADTCQILFVASSQGKRSQFEIQDFKAPGVLTVGESPGFAAEGGIVNFKLEGGRVRLEINLVAAEHAQLRISSKLLNLAEIVKK
jgi:hypothetical protein